MGNGVNAPQAYRDALAKHYEEVTGYPLSQRMIKLMQHRI